MIMKFVSTRCSTTDPSEWTPSAEIYEAFLAWCRETSQTPCTPNMLGRRLGGLVCRKRSGGHVMYRLRLLPAEMS